MSDTAPTSAPAAPASTPATPAQPNPHHAARQPREQGRFAGPPGEATSPTPGEGQGEAPATPPKPKAWKLGDREVTDPDELYAVAASKEVERRRLEELAREAEELRAFKAKLEKDRGAAFQTQEEARAFALKLIREQMEEEAMTPAERAQRDRERKLAEREQAIREHEEKEKARAQAEADAKAKTHLVGVLREAMDASGLPPTDENLRRLARKMKQNLALGLNYPPAVLARQVAKEWETETRGGLEKLTPAQLVERLPFLLEKLEAIDDPALLKRLGKLGEKLRRLNLESLGATPSGGAPPAQAAPVVANPSAARHQKPREEWTAQDYEEEFRDRARA